MAVSLESRFRHTFSANAATDAVRSAECDEQARRRAIERRGIAGVVRDRSQLAFRMISFAVLRLAVCRPGIARDVSDQ